MALSNDELKSLHDDALTNSIKSKQSNAQLVIDCRREFARLILARAAQEIKGVRMEPVNDDNDSWYNAGVVDALYNLEKLAKDIGSLIPPKQEQE